MTAISTILISELKEFYPVTDSLSQDKIDAQMLFVKNNIFLAMFGLSITSEIFDGTIEDNDNDNFIGFRKFVALNIVGQLVEDAYVHTNAGLKIVNSAGWQTPRNAEKSSSLNKISNTIEAQFVEAKKVLTALGKLPKNEYKGYGTFNIEKI